MSNIIIIGLLVIIAGLAIALLLSRKKYKHLETRCAQYLTELDKKNQTLRTGVRPKKAGRDYKKLLQKKN